MKKLILSLVIAVPLLCGAKKYSDIGPVDFVKNYDGDTITVNLYNTDPIFGENISVRVNGIDTPEIRGKCEKEKTIAKQAKSVVNYILNNSTYVYLKNPNRGKYFRIVADVYADDVNIADILLERGLAIPYDGGKKTKNWCK